MMEKRTLLFMHIPKTGGTTFRVFLDKEYGVSSENNWEKGVHYIYAKHGNYNIWDLAYGCKARKPEVVVGHFPYGLHRMFDGPYDYVSLLRHPVDRIISAYAWVMQNLELPHFAKYKDWSLEQYSEELFLKNGMTRCFVYRDCRIPEDEWLTIAKKNLDEDFALFGITEKFSEFIQAGAKKFGWSTTDYTVENVSKIRIEATESQIKIIESKCEMDLEFYDYATQLFEAKFS